MLSQAFALYQTDNKFDGKGQIRYFGEAIRVALVKRGSIKEIPVRRNNSDELYYRITVREWLDITDTNESGKAILPKVQTEFTSVALLGAVSCGVPTLEEEYIEEYVSLPASMFGKGTFFLLRAKGESMIEAGISPGDLVLVRKQSEAMDGDIVVALVANENTLKRYFVDKENQKIRLHPENKTMKDIIVSDCKIQGVAVKVIKNLE